MIEQIVRWCNYAGRGILLALMCFITVDVVMRYLFKSPIKGDVEIDEFGLVIVVFLGLSYTAVVKGHVSVDFFVSKIAPRKRAIIEVINNFVGTAVFALIAWEGAQSALQSMMWNEVTDALRLPVYPFRFFVTLGSVLLCLVLITHIVQGISQIRKGAG